MTTEQILQMNIKQLEKLTPKELRESVSTLRSTSRKRYERVVENDLYSPAVKSLRKSAKEDIFATVRGMTDEQLVNEFKRYRQFLKAPTSTVVGTKKANKKLRKETQKATGVDFDTDEMLHYYSLVDQARTTEVGGVVDYHIIKEVTEEVFKKHKVKRKETKKENKRFNRSVLKEIEKRLQEVYDEENTPSAVYPSKSIKK